MNWRLTLLAAVAAMGLQACDQEPARTAVTPPAASLPDSTVLNAPATAPETAPTMAPATASGTAPATAPAATPDPAVAAAPPADVAPPQAAPEAPADPSQQAAAATPPGTSPDIPGSAATGDGAAAPATPMGAAPAVPPADAGAPPAPGTLAEAIPPGGQGTAAMTEMWQAFPPGGQAASAKGAASAPARAAASAPAKVSSNLPTVHNPGDREGAALLAQRRLEVPVVGVLPTSLTNQYDLSRGNRKHEAIDIVAPLGTPVVAIDDGRVAKLFTSQPGGLTVYQFDPQQRLAYYYAHLQRYAEGLREGMNLRRGDLIGYVGTSGNADARTPHLHFAVFKLGNPPRWWQGEPVNPYPALSRAQPADRMASR